MLFTKQINKNAEVSFPPTLRWYQGRIQSKFEGGAVGSGGVEKFSKISDESTLYTTISDLFSE